LKASGNISAKTKRSPSGSIGQSQSELQSSPANARQFELSGPSEHPDPTRFAYREDLADIALAGVVIASHYAAPVGRTLKGRTKLFEAASQDSAEITTLEAGEPFDLLDDSLGWVWGYAGADRRVGYVRSSALG
jgi:hypothetical protein